jgi:hypothetical protein
VVKLDRKIIFLVINRGETAENKMIWGLALPVLQIFLFRLDARAESQGAGAS